MDESNAVPVPNDGGIHSSPVRNERIQVPASARTNDSSMIANISAAAFKALSYFNGVLLDEWNLTMA
jgi:hypothetical protein